MSKQVGDFFKLGFNCGLGLDRARIESICSCSRDRQDDGLQCSRASHSPHQVSINMPQMLGNTAWFHTKSCPPPPLFPPTTHPHHPPTHPQPCRLAQFRLSLAAVPGHCGPTLRRKKNPQYAAILPLARTGREGGPGSLTHFTEENDATGREFAGDCGHDLMEHCVGCCRH